MSWFSRLFGKAKSPQPAKAHAPTPTPVPAPASGRTEALPPEAFVGARAASREVLGLAMAALKDQRGIHLESLFCALGALAGRACQDSVRAQAQAEGKSADAWFDVATTTDGGRFYFGDALNRPLAEDRVSLWSLVAGAAAHDGVKQLPDLDEMFRHNAAVLGSAEFGMPRLPAAHPVHARPVEYAERLWPSVRPILAAQAGEPRMWPVAIGLAIQELMAQTRGNVPPEIVVRIVMESAIPVSKIPV